MSKRTGVVQLLCLLCVGLAGAQEDAPVVETPEPLQTEAEAQGTRLEDQPEIDDLPDWLIDIPPEEKAQAGAAQQTPLLQFEEEDSHVISESRMFSVSGGDALRMGAIATHADELYGRLRKLLELKDKWKYPISIRLLGNTADAATPHPIRTRIRIVGNAPDLQIRIHAGGGINTNELDAAIIRILLYEYAMRGVQPDALPDYLELPPWLVSGVQQAILWQQGKVDRRLYQNLFNKSEMMSPEEIMDTASPDKLDAGSRQLYDVSCGVLIMGLLHQKGGADQLRNLLSEAHTQEGKIREVLAAHFHEMESENNSFSKWWALELAALSQPDAMEMLTPIETEKQLEEALMLTAVDKDTRVPYFVNLTDLAQTLKLPSWQALMRPCIDRLTELNLRCFPGYRAIIAEYIRAIGELLRGSAPKKVQEILTPLSELREAYKEASIRGRDYLDWYEITHLGNSQRQNFDTYREAMQMLRKDEPGPATHMSQYLDDIEALHNLKEGQPLPRHLKDQAQQKKP